MIRLGVNIDHVATLRQARGESYPSLVEAARVCLREGADQITIHLREDRRHVQDTDVEAIRLVTREFSKPLNLEMGCNEDILRVAFATAPDWICLVPERREEQTTECGLDLLNEVNYLKVKDYCNRLKEKIPNVKISLFLDANLPILEKTVGLAIDAVEIHTGEFAKAFLDNEELEPHLQSFEVAQKFLEKVKLGCHAGHGLTYESTLKLLKKGYFVEYNIGHWIICESIFQGLGNVVRKLKGQFDARS